MACCQVSLLDLGRIINKSYLSQKIQTLPSNYRNMIDWKADSKRSSNIHRRFPENLLSQCLWLSRVWAAMADAPLPTVLVTGAGGRTGNFMYFLFPSPFQNLQAFHDSNLFNHWNEMKWIAFLLFVFWFGKFCTIKNLGFWWYIHVTLLVEFRGGV